MTRFTIHVPRKLNDGTITDYRELERVEDELLDIAGGWTSAHAVGAWRSPDTGESYREPYQLYHVDSDDDIAPELLALAERTAQRLDQEAIYVTAQTVGVTLVAAQRDREPVLA